MNNILLWVAATSGAAGGVSLAGTINGVSSTTLSLTVAKGIAGTINGVSSTTLSLTVAKNIAGVINGVSSTTCNISKDVSLVGVINGVSSTTLSLAVAKSISGIINGVSTTTCTIGVGAVNIAGIINGVSSTTCAITVHKWDAILTEFSPDLSPVFGSLDILTGELDLNDNRVDNISDLNFTSATELTISSGAVTATKGHHSIDTEGNAANDDLDTINGGESGDILLILPADDGHTVRIRHGVGNVYLKHQTAEQSYNFNSPTGGGGTFYIAGYYDWSSTDAGLNQTSPTSVTHGASNVSYAAHVSIVAGGAGVVDTGVVKITVAGTTIDDEGNRAASQTVDLVADITTLALNQYVETTEKFIGQVTIALATASGSPVNFNVDINYGFSKYEDIGNTNYNITLLECVGRAGANDTGFNIRLFHHNASDWTYAASGFIPGPTAGDASELANMNIDHSTEQNLSSGEPFAYKRTDLNQDINGDNGEGVVIEITTSSGRAVEAMDAHIGVHSAPKFGYMATTKQHLIFMKHGPNWLEL